MRERIFGVGNVYDYGARWYDASVGRFMGVDPIAEEFHWVSPYNYAENSPIANIDLWGLQAYSSNNLFYAHKHGGGELFDKVNTVNQITGGGQIAGAAVVVAAVAGPEATAGFLINEAKDEVLSQATGGLSDVADITKMATKGIKELASSGDKLSSGLGDLTVKEVDQIQSVVDDAGRPLEVVGSAAEGTRRNVGTDLPIGKGPGTKSDIDYLVPPSSLDHFSENQKWLPGLDLNTGIIPGVHNPNIGPGIRFEPGGTPKVIE